MFLCYTVDASYKRLGTPRARYDHGSKEGTRTLPPEISLPATALMCHNQSYFVAIVVIVIVGTLCWGNVDVGTWITPEGVAFLEKLIVSHLEKEFPALLWNKNFK
jgi:hypothetical protein